MQVNVTTSSLSKQRICEYCGKAFAMLHPSDKRRHCSWQCYSLHRKAPPQTRVCEWCGRAFLPASSSKTQRFCGQFCWGASRRLPPTVRGCPVCGRQFTVRHPTIKQQCCSQSCCRTFQARPVSERFWEKVQKTEGCWFWIAAHSGDRYGRIRRGLRSGEYVKAHRMSWELHYGPIPEGMEVLHQCDTPLCVRPDHLFLGTQLDNMRDMIAKGRDCRGEQISTAKLTAADVIAIRNAYKAGARQGFLAEQYGVSINTVGHVTRRESWRHIL